MTTKPNPSLLELADDREARVLAEDRRRAGFPEYDAVMAPEILAARERITHRRAVAADGATLPALQSALSLFAMHTGYTRDSIAWRLRAEAAGSLQRAIDSLTADIDRDERLIAAIESPSLETLKAWSPDAFRRTQLDRLRGMVQDARGIDHLLAVDVPRWEAEIRRRLTGAAIDPPPSPQVESTAVRQQLASSSTRDEC